MERVRQQGIGALSSRVTTDGVPQADPETHATTSGSTPMEPSTIGSDTRAEVLQVFSFLPLF